MILITYYHVHSCFSTWELVSCFPLSKSCNHVDQSNPHHVLSKQIFTDQKYLLPLKSYGDFHNSMYLVSTTKQTLEMKKTTGEDYFYQPYRALCYNNVQWILDCSFGDSTYLCRLLVTRL